MSAQRQFNHAEIYKTGDLKIDVKLITIKYI